MEDSQLISQKSTILHDQFGLPMRAALAAHVDPINGWSHQPTGEVYAELQCASRAPPCPSRTTRADLNLPICRLTKGEKKAPAAKWDDTACQMAQRSDDCFSAVTLSYNYTSCL
jgi:hypothetical protein